MLRKWQAGSLSAKDVHLWGDDLYPAVEFNDWEGDAENSVAKEVLCALSMLDMNLMTMEDVPIYLEFLSTAHGAFIEGYERYERALEHIDYQAWRQKLGAEPLYARNCA